ncbi:MAG: hypothetical protein KAG94_04150 [Clostridiales bacterium]|nr:hypothetical protein [Clostridiales bacterium]
MKKKLLLLKNSFYHFIRSEKAVLTLIILGMTVGYMTFIIISGVLNSQFEVKGDSSGYNSVSIFLNSNENIEADIMKFLDEEPLGELYNALLIDVGEEGANVIGWKGTSFTRWHAMDQDSAFFTLDQSESDDNIVFISEYLDMLGENTFTFENVEYRIIKQSQLIMFMFIRELPYEVIYFKDESGCSDTIIIPYKTFINNGFKTDILRLDLKQSIHVDKGSNMEKIQSYFEGQEIYFSDSVYQDETETKRVALIRFIFIGMCILALINIFSLFNYWVKHNRKQYFIYAFCGASNTTTFILIASEWFGINLVSFGLGLVLVLAVQSPLAYLGITIKLFVLENALLLVVGYILSFMFSLKTVLKVSNTMNKFDLRGDVS